MSEIYRRILIEQDTDEWHALRAVSIGASDAAAIMGVSKWETPRTTYKRKKGLMPAKEQTESMRKGKEIEESIRHSFMVQKNVFVVPAVIQSIETPYLIASLDGLSFEGDKMVEIKFANREDHECAKNGVVPDHYYPQVQHQMMVAGHDKMFYASLNEDDLVIFEVARDQEYIDELIIKEEEFFECLRTNTPPAYTEDEHLEIEADFEQIMTIQLYKDATTQLNFLKKKQEELKEQIVSWGEDGNIEFISPEGSKLCRLTRVEREGPLDIKKLCSDLGITDDQVNQYRKPQIGYYKIG